ncbi:hypothetical protein B0H67DRAFT_647495 [Lasiosphaeris hirsuta]|uniref:Uncharacterized protein n=1 Tax=Lasiosphaeris hirsuta TaxID=260670 RepID=A0AA40DL73_9PEZI|nr:hypothetical protein B0H67DRAFT_647495 [Lasiosphaeris hirsuta]
MNDDLFEKTLWHFGDSPFFDGKEFRRSPNYLKNLLQFSQEPWKIPTEAELDTFFEQASCTQEEGDNMCSREYWVEDEGKYRFSAAAAAIYSLRSITAVTRQHMRKIVLYEDRPSVGSPDSQPRGLAPFCTENPAPRVECRVSHWRNCFLKGFSGSRSKTEMDQWIFDSLTHHKTDPGRPAAEMICEASLFPEQKTLVFDCEGAPELTAEVFQDAIHRDAAWQTAMDRPRAVPPRGWSVPPYQHGAPPFHCKGFPELLRRLWEKDPTCRVRCDGFDPGHPWDDAQIDAIAEANRAYSETDDSHHWRSMRWMEAYMVDAEVWATRHRRRCRPFTTCWPRT